MKTEKKFSIRLVLCALMMFFSVSVMAQTTITGSVQDESGEPVIGATIRESGTKSAVVSDLDGKYSIKVRDNNATLNVSYVGYQSQTVKVAGRKTVTIILTADETTLNDVVVVGYGTMKRSDLTGATSSISEKAIKQGVNTSLEQAMQGRIAGVNVTQNSGAPGGGISVQVRGVNSLSGNEPLYVVDGIAMSGSSSSNGNSSTSNTSVLASINPSDITSIEVLKDASATAIYGSRASNGVVLITTKRGQEGAAKISYEGYMGWQQLPKQLDVMNLQEYAKFYNDRANLWGWGAMEQYKDPSCLTEGTNWQDELFRTAFMHNHQVSVNGGSESTKYNLSGGYLDQEGIGIGSSFNRVSFRANLDTKITDWLSIGANGYFAKTHQVTTFEGIQTGTSSSSAIKTALTQTPDVAVKTPDGEFDTGAENEYNYSSNPLFDATMKNNETKNSQFDYNLFANITPIKNLVIRLEYGGSLGWGDIYQFTPEYSYGTNNAQKVESLDSRVTSRNSYQSFKQYATYDWDPWKHNHLQIMAGHEAQWGDWSNIQGTRKGYISSSIQSLHVGDASTATNDEQGSEWAIESYYGRLNYNFHDRYLFTGTLRTDGSSSFSSKNRWGWFPSVAFAWRINNEAFLKNVHWVNNLKLRVGWGLVGNQNGGSYAYGVSMGTTPTAWGTGYYPSNYANENLKWERTKAWNFGLDMAFLNNRIEFIVDAYLKKTDNLLMQASLPTYVVDLDGYRGITAPYVNSGAIENKGVEFTLNTVNIAKKDWQWKTGLTLSFNRNKLTALNSEDSQLFGTIGSDTYTMSEVGGPVGRFYGYNVIGMYTCEDDFYQKNSLGEFLLDASGNKIPVARPVDSDGNMYEIKENGIWVGDYIYEDVNKDGKITEADRKFIGDPNPDFTFGLNNTITYKNFELSFFINGSYGNDIYNLVRNERTDPSGWGNKMTFVTNAATIALKDPSGKESDISNVYISNADNASCYRIEPSSGGQNDNDRVCSKYIEDGSYIRLKSISLAWNLPSKWTNKIGFEWIQIYANAQNLFTITGYDGYDPEIGSASGQSVILQGIDNYRYPSQRIYNIGLKATLGAKKKAKKIL